MKTIGQMKTEDIIEFIIILIIICLVFPILTYKMGVAHGELESIERYMAVYPAAPEYTEPDTTEAGL